MTETLEGRLDSAKQALKNSTLDLTNVTAIETLKDQINSKKEPYQKGSKKLNVDGITILEPIDNGIVSQKTLSNNIYHRIVHIMKLSTQEYYNMRTVLDLKCT